MPNELKEIAYHWADSELLQSVEVYARGRQKIVAYLEAKDGADPAKLGALRERFAKKGWTVSADIRGGKPILRLTGPENDQALLGFLKQGQYVAGEPQMKLLTAETHGLLDAAKANSLHASSLFYLLGDALFVISGVARKNEPAQIATGASFAVGDVMLAAFGGKKEDLQLQNLVEKLSDHLAQKGIQIPEGSAIKTETMAKPGGFLEHTYDYIHEHVNVVKILAEVLGGAAYYKAGVNQQNPRKQAAGAVIVTGWAAALAVHEKKADPETLAHGNFFQKIAAKIQQNPLSLAGGAGLIHNALSTIGVFEERAKYQGGSRNYRWDMAGICAMLLGNSLYAISSKATDGRSGGNSMVADVYGLAAEILASQSPAVCEAAIETTADFLAQRIEIKDSREAIIQKLQEHLTERTKNPWFEHTVAVPPEAPLSHVGKVARQASAAEAVSYHI